MGRPRSEDPDKNKLKRLDVRLTDARKLIYKGVAKESGMSLSEWVLKSLDSSVETKLFNSDYCGDKK